MFYPPACFRTVTVIIAFIIITNVTEPLFGCQEPNQKRILSEHTRGMVGGKRKRKERNLTAAFRFELSKVGCRAGGGVEW